MNKKLTPRYIIIAIVLLWAIYSLWPSIQYQLMSDDRKEEMRASGTLYDLESKIIKQGLDLKGGMYIVLEVDIPNLVSKLAINHDDKFDQVLSSIASQMDRNYHSSIERRS
jgi:preprotein translocase subunit SecD